jgi:hypothetical protein
MHETIVHRALREYVGSGLATVTSQGVLISDNGGRCSMSLVPPNFMEDGTPGSSLRIALNGEPTPFFFADDCFRGNGNEVPQATPASEP